MEIINTELLNKPELYFNEDTLIESHQVVATIRDFFYQLLVKELPNRDQQLKEWKDGIIEKYGESVTGGSQQSHDDQITHRRINSKQRIKKRNQKSPNILFLNTSPFNTFTPDEWVNIFGRDALISIIWKLKQPYS